jgi:transposase
LLTYFFAPTYTSGEIELFYFDEAGFNLTSNVPYAWQPTGKHIEIPSSKSKSFNVLGFVNKACQFESFVFQGAITTGVVIGCFNEMQQKIIKPTFVLIDNAPIHTSYKFDQATIEWAKNGLIVVPISNYSPELNLIEIVWRKIKYEWMPFSAYQSIDSLQDALFDILGKIGSKFKIDFC